MKAPKTISPLHIVPDQQAPVKPLLTKEEKQFLNLLAEIFVSDLLKKKETSLKTS